jgi:hypothetical protein
VARSLRGGASVTSVRSRQDIAADYQNARDAGDAHAMARFRNEEACLILLTVLEQLAANPDSFIHEVAIKGRHLDGRRAPFTPVRHDSSLSERLKLSGLRALRPPSFRKPRFVIWSSRARNGGLEGRVGFGPTTSRLKGRTGATAGVRQRAV